jgi:tRNA(Ile)-lysidine synthase
MSSSTYRAFVAAVRADGLFGASDRVVAAVSGGPDSIVLLDCLSRYLGEEARTRLLVAHLDHRLRAASAEDAAFVRACARAREIGCVIEERDVGAYARSRSLSVEDAARRLRYSFLYRVAVDWGASVVAAGHHADDQAETVLLRMIRGSGLRGLGGMRPSRPLRATHAVPRLVRPLLGVPRAEIEAHLRAHGLESRVDETNAELQYRRNFVRHRVLPLIRESLQPRITEVLCRLGRIAAEVSAHLDEEVLRVTGAPVAGEPFVLPVEVWRAMPKALRAEALNAGFSAATGGRSLGFAHLEAVAGIVERGGDGSIDLPDGWSAEVAQETIRLLPRREEPPVPPPPWRVDLPVPGDARLPDGRIVRARVRPRTGGEPAPRGCAGARASECLDYDAAGRPARLTVRGRLPGDRFRPLGSAGSRTVKRFLIDAKVPRAERGRTPILTVPGGTILWIAPHRIDDRAKVTEQTSELLELGLE